MNSSKGILYPVLLISGITVTLFSLLGIATITGWIPKANSQDTMPMSRIVENPATNVLSVPYGEAQAEQRKRFSQQQRVAPATVCHSCGMVTAIRTTVIAAKPTGIGAVAGGVLGAVVGNQIGAGNGRTAMTIVGVASGAYAGNEVEKRSKSQLRYSVHVRLDGGGYRTFYLNHAPDYSEGQRVRIVQGHPVPSGRTTIT
ncbi:MAG: glycine zipper 2TM domain-containing protein [Sulfuriferula sp.]